MKIVNQHLNYPKAPLMEPNKKGYIQIGIEVDYSPFPFFLSDSSKKRELLEKAGEMLEKISRMEGVSAASLFRAAMMPPARQSFLDSIKGSIHVARFDVAVLIEAADVAGAKILSRSDTVQELKKYLEENSSFVHFAVFENARRIDEVDKSKGGIFLFNHFFAEDPEELLDVWEYTAGWFTSNTALDNSTLLMPLKDQDSKYGVINHCRWDKLSAILPKLVFSRTLRLYVRDNFVVNKIASMPILYRVVKHSKGTA